MNVEPTLKDEEDLRKGIQASLIEQSKPPLQEGEGTSKAGGPLEKEREGRGEGLLVNYLESNKENSPSPKEQNKRKTLKFYEKWLPKSHLPKS